MPPIELCSPYQKAVLWAAVAGDNNNYGVQRVSAGIELDVRWEQDDAEVQDPQAGLVKTDTLVIVDRDIPPRSIMWLGALADLPSPPTNLKQVIVSGGAADVKGRFTQYDVRLMSFSNNLPEIV